jgi:hypothetical protein
MFANKENFILSFSMWVPFIEISLLVLLYWLEPPLPYQIRVVRVDISALLSILGEDTQFPPLNMTLAVTFS